MKPSPPIKRSRNEGSNNSAASSTNLAYEIPLTGRLSEPSLASGVESNERNLEELRSFNEIPEPIQTLDDILSEFEEPDSLPHGSFLQENQSEDDGYMSLNSRSQGQKSSPTSNNLHQSDNLANITEMSTQSTDIASKEQTTALIQTLPKKRSTASNKGNYSSLPCTSLRSSALGSKNRVGSCSGARNVLGIDISAVHDAVLRGGVAKLPEPILNEHPVTIYPGRQRTATLDQAAHSWLNKMANLPAKSPTQRLDGDDATNNIRKSCGVTSASPTESDKLSSEVNEDSDEFSEDSLDGPQEENSSASAFTVSAPVTPYKQSGIAWEIKFKNSRQSDFRRSKSSNKLKNKNSKKGDVSVLQISLEENSRNLCEGEDVPEVLTAPPSNGKFKLEDIFKQHPDTRRSDFSKNQDSYNIFVKTNDSHGYTAIEGSMLGKGTFIIRRRPRNRMQGPEVYDVPNPSNNVDNPIENGSDMKETQNNVNLKKPTAPSSALQKLTRARLSLNLDSEPIEPAAASKPQARKVATEALDFISKQQSCESLNTTPTSNLPGNFKNPCDSLQANVKAPICLRSPDPNEHISTCTTPHRELAPTMEEEEEQCSESQSGSAPLRQIEHNISALLRGDIAVARIPEAAATRRSLGYRPGVHKSESAKEMLLSQNAFGPLPPSPPISSPDMKDLPPLPPSPAGTDIDDNILDSEIVPAYPIRTAKDKSRSTIKLSKYDLPLPPTPQEAIAPAVPPHRGSSHNQTLRSRSIDSHYTRKCPKTISHSGSAVIPMGYGHSAYDVAYTSRRAVGSCGLKLKQSPREEHRLQTSCSLPETPIFSRGCTPPRRQVEYVVGSGCRTAPRSGASQTTNMGSSIVGISGVGISRQRAINHVLASGEMLRLSGGPARGWYPKQRSMRPASTENIDRLPLSHAAAMRVWDSAGGMGGTGHVRKPLTLPPNLTPSFLNKSPREALRRVTSLLINKKGSSKERDNKISKENMLESNNGRVSRGKTSLQESTSKQCHSSTQKSQKKKGFFKQFWKKSKHYSLDQ